ncbi:hypothetical protein P152DRAFT_405188, partial [Eremomyces bilateralis CBS 781.70]
RQLHSLGFVHGDLYKYNMVLQGNDVKFINFEASEVRDDCEKKNSRDRCCWNWLLWARS